MWRGGYFVPNFLHFVSVNTMPSSYFQFTLVCEYAQLHFSFVLRTHRQENIDREKSKPSKHPDLHKHGASEDMKCFLREVLQSHYNQSKLLFVLVQYHSWMTVIHEVIIPIVEGFSNGSWKLICVMKNSGRSVGRRIWFVMKGCVSTSFNIKIGLWCCGSRVTNVLDTHGMHHTQFPG